MSNDAGNFLRKMVKFVANPTTDWAELDAAGETDRESEYAKAEIKAMIERKRRNDFVRKRELDMLRKIRREGLTGDSALALTAPSNLDSESRSNSGAKSDIAVKAKIDEIEQQMVGSSDASRRGDTRQAPMGASGMSAAPTLPAAGARDDATTAQRPAPRELPPLTLDISDEVMAAARAQAPRTAHDPRPSSSAMAPSGFANPFAVDVCEVVHDPDLDEAVIAFANADFEQCEKSLVSLLQPGGAKHDSSESWMVLFDFYRALDLPQRFDSLANAFAMKFGQSAPQWYSLPERVSAHLSGKPPTTSPTTPAPQTAPTEEALQRTLEGWIAPPTLDIDAIGRLRCEVLQLPRPWVMDWAGVERINAEAAAQLASIFKQWAQDASQMTWIGVDQLESALTEQAPTGVKDADPAFWMLRLEMLRLSNRADKFDEVAIDYCVTYELSPPSWENAACTVKLMSDATCTQTVSLSHISDVSTSFVESQLHEDDHIAIVQQASLELAGQMVGDIGSTLNELDRQLGTSSMVQLDCSHLIRVDFIAAGDLLNWVLARRAEHRNIHFINPHRLVALFFGAMGITEHAKVKLQLV
jgi:ABC-type transporter Mla MlaB component